MSAPIPFCTVAIDGGAASGKTTAARGLARAAHFLHVDTGLHYRAVTALALAARVPPEDDALTAWLRGLSLGTVVADREAQLAIGGRVPASDELRSAEVNAQVSAYAAAPAVRTFLRGYQQSLPELARREGFKGLVMDGRDIGTHILPQADLKVYLEAAATTRQARRDQEGISGDRIDERDRQDSGRTTAPLARAPDAEIIDTGALNAEAVVARLQELLASRHGTPMPLVCLDLEGVLLPEMWIAIAEAISVPELKRTTRDEPDYDVLMRYRLDILAAHDLTLARMQEIIAGLEPLPGAIDFTRWLVSQCRLIILSDTFAPFAAPLMAKLGYPTLFCHDLIIADDGRIADYRLRLRDHKRKAVEAFQQLNFRVAAAGDSYNDLSMLATADHGILYCPPERLRHELPHYPVALDHSELRAALEAFLVSSAGN